MNSQANLPRLVAGLGDTLLDVRQRSTFAVRTDPLSDDDLVAADKPVQFVFRGPHPFDLAPTRFVSLECTAALVTAIQSSPHMDYLEMAASRSLLDSLNRRVLEAGWRIDREEGPVPTAAELELSLRDPALADDTWWFVAIYASGSARLYVKLRRTHRAGRAGAADLFLVTLQWRDDSLLDRALEVAKRLRQQDGVPINRDRPIALESYAARVRDFIPVPP